MNNMFAFQIDKNSTYRTPKDIIEEQCKFLKEMTDDYVIGKVNDYSGQIQNYTEPGLADSALVISQAFSGKTVDIQSKLGELSDGTFTYDFFLSSKYTPNYVYRIMFLRHGITPYPVTLVLDEEVATQINYFSEITCNSEKEFEEILSKTLNSKKCSTVIQNLYLLNKQTDDDFPF